MPPLEGFWIWEPVGLSDRSQWRWTSRIRRPQFVTQTVLEWAAQEAAKKKPELNFGRVYLSDIEEGLCVQAIHIGPYSGEPATMEKLSAFMADKGLPPNYSAQRRHHEIYLSNPRKTASHKLKTVLRVPV